MHTPLIFLVALCWITIESFVYDSCIQIYHEYKNILDTSVEEVADL